MSLLSTVLQLSVIQKSFETGKLFFYMLVPSSIISLCLLLVSFQYLGKIALDGEAAIEGDLSNSPTLPYDEAAVL